MKILIVDSDPGLLDALVSGLRQRWNRVAVLSALTGEAAVQLFYQHSPTVVVLDMDISANSDWELLHEFRQLSDAWLIATSARADETVQVAALETGADAFLVKPFSSALLAARIKAILRGGQGGCTRCSDIDLVCGGLTLSLRTRQVTVNGQTARLTPAEYRLLLHLMRNPGHVVSRGALLQRVWPGRQSATAAHLKVIISRLRAKIKSTEGQTYIATERGKGYRFVGQPAAHPADHPMWSHHHVEGSST